MNFSGTCTSEAGSRSGAAHAAARQPIMIGHSIASPGATYHRGLRDFLVTIFGLAGGRLDPASP